MAEGRILGIDYGERRVGLAIADPLGMFSQPLGTLSKSDAIAELIRIDQSEGIDVLVVGWPLLPDGSEGETTLAVAKYINRLKRFLPDATIVKWDERYTSEMAKEMIAGSEKPSMRTTGRGRIDTAAAGIVLQEYLNGC